MFSAIWVLSALCATALSAPTFSTVAAARPVEIKILSEYFQMLGREVQAAKNIVPAPACNMNNAVMPVASPTPLPPPSAGLTLKHVAIGRGTQNYSCGANETAAPIPLGAVATLYNASCVASTYPNLLSIMPHVALRFNLKDMDQSTLPPSNLAISGYHYFSNLTTPIFDLKTTAVDLGFAPCAKNNSVAAPASAPEGQDSEGQDSEGQDSEGQDSKGQDSEGFGAVAWLKLLTGDAATSNLKEVYRVNTAGGNRPATCAGMPPTFEVQYAAEYWFYGFR